MRLTDRIRASLGQTEVAHFSCLNEGLYRSGNILHGYVRINTVLVEEVDPIGTQALERVVGDLADALRAAVRPLGRNAVPEAKFRCDDHLVAHRLKRLAHDLFIEAWAIGFVFLRRLGREEQALPWFDRALEIRPNVLAARSNKSFALSQLHRFTDAIAVYDEVEAADPGKAEADLYASLVHLLTGNFELGWAGREARTKLSNPQIIRLEFSQPRWLGKERIDGKTILLHTDEGLGDAIQFLRYAPMVAALGARVVVVVPDAVCPLLSRLEGVSQCIPLSETALPAFDLYCPLTSLPLAFGTRLDTIPSTTPYLSARAESLPAWEARLGAHDGLRVGLVWSGNPKHRNDYNRSMPLSMLAPILDVGARFLSLQKDPRPDDKAFLLARPEIIDHTAELTGFAETAALISCLDLVITVDTSVAHLAGALGCPTWILLPHTPDWRWLLDRDDSPWYPSARLFRQDETRDYTSVVARVRHELVKLVAAKKVIAEAQP